VFEQLKWTSRFDALIFDLDDTLLDTTGQLIVPAVRRACNAMIEVGLRAELDSAVAAHEKYFRERPRENVYHLIAEHFGMDGATSPAEAGRIGSRSYTHFELDRPLDLFEGVHDLLAALRGRYDLHLVTSGSPTTQRQKIDATGVAEYVRSIHLVDSAKGARKREAFLEIISGERYTPERVVCIGDRPDKEIRDAKQLGMVTCRVRYGEYAHLDPAEPDEHPDHSISRVTELIRILAD
jgi:FMN phosphatase YigB (HAD superfamily)